MNTLIHFINQSLPASLSTLAIYNHITLGHGILFVILIAIIFTLKYLFQNPLRKFILYRLYKKRKDIVYKLMFHRLDKLVRPFRYIVSLFVFEKAIGIFLAEQEQSFFFYIVYLLLFAWWFYEIIKFITYTSLSVKIEKGKEVHQELFVLFLNIFKVIIALVVIFALLSRMGVDLTGLITSLGVGGIVLGFSAKDTLTNFFDSIRLIGEDAFHIGDWIETEEVEGIVTEVGLAATNIRTFDNALVTIPNSKLASSYIKNWSKRKVGRRIKFDLRVKHTYDMAELENVVNDIRNMLNNHPEIMNDQKVKYFVRMKKTYKDAIFNLHDNVGAGVGGKLLVYFDDIDEYSMNILVYAFTISVNWEDWLSVKQDILKEIILIIDKSKLELAIPREEIVLGKSLATD